MKRKNISRSLAVVLCASMLFTGEPASALAARADPAQQTVKEGTKTPVKDTGDTQTGTEASAPAGTESQSTEKQDTEAGNTETPETGQEAAGNGTETEVDGSTESAVTETEAAGTEAESTEKITSTETAAVDEILTPDARKKTDSGELKDLLPRKKKADGPEVIEVSSLLELADAVSQTEGTVAPAYTFTPGGATAVVNGEEVEMSTGCKGADGALEVPADVFAADRAVDADAIADKSGMAGVAEIAENSGYELAAGDGTVSLVSPVGNRRLIVQSDTGFDTCGAETVIQGYGSLYILMYASESDAAAAYDGISEQGIAVETEAVMTVSTDEADAGTGSEETGILQDERYLDMPVNSREIRVAVIDSGYDAADSCMDKIVDGADMSGSGTIQDENGHGTAIANIIAEKTSGQVKIMPVRVTDAAGHTSSLKLYLALQYAMEQRADIINVSLTAYKSSGSTLIKTAIDAAKEKGIFVVTAAGNSSDDTAGYSPADVESAIVVSAVNQDGSLMDYSNHGNTVDFAAYGKLAAAGLNNEIQEVSGTSVSAALVSVVIAQMLVFDNSIPYDTIIKSMQDGADDLGGPGWDTSYGYGLLTPEHVNGLYDGTVCENAAILTCDWKNMTDEELDELVFNTGEATLGRFVRDLNAEDAEELLKKDTKLSRNYAVTPSDADGNPLETTEYDSFYEYLLETEYTTQFAISNSGSTGSFTVTAESPDKKKTYKVRYTFKLEKNDGGGTDHPYKLKSQDSSGDTGQIKAKWKVSKGVGKAYVYFATSGEASFRIPAMSGYDKDAHYGFKSHSSSAGSQSGFANVDKCNKQDANSNIDTGIQVAMYHAGYGVDTYPTGVHTDMHVNIKEMNLGSSTGNWNVVQNATCTANGIRERKTKSKCSKCGNNYTTTETQVIAELGHAAYLRDWAEATCTSASIEIYYCSRCGAHLRTTNDTKALGHIDTSPWNTAYSVSNGIANGGRTDYQDCTRCGTRLGTNVYFLQQRYVHYQNVDGNYGGPQTNYYGYVPQGAAFSALDIAAVPPVNNAAHSDGYTVTGAEIRNVYVTRMTYNVTFHANDDSGAVKTRITGTFPSSLVNSRYGTGYTTDPGTAFSRKSYLFGGWNTKADGTGTSHTPGTARTVEGNLDLYAQWKIRAHTLTYTGNGGTPSIPKQTVYFDQPYGVNGQKLATANRAGYIFRGWFTKAGGGTQITTDTMCRGDATVYAHWAKRFDITLNSTGIDSVTKNKVIPDDPGTQKIYKADDKYGVYSGSGCEDKEKLEKINIPAKKNHTFNGYFNGDTMMADENGRVLDSSIGSESQTWEAKWTRNTFIVTLDNSGAVNGGTDAVYEKCNTKDFYSNTELGEKIDKITMPDFGSNLFLGYFDKDGKQVIDENGRIVCDRILDKDETWTAKWDTQINISYIGNEKQDSDQYKINYIGTGDDFTDPDVELESTYEFSDNMDDDGKNHFKRTVTKEVDEKYEPNGELKVQSKIVAWQIGARTSDNNQFQVSSDENISDVKAETLLKKGIDTGTITFGSPTNAYKSADAKLDEMANAGKLSVKNVLGIVSDALGFTGNKAKAASAEDLRRYINMYAVWDNGPTLEAKDLYISLDMARDESENGVTEEWLLSMANAYDDELKGVTDAKGTVKHGKDTVNGTEFKVLGYDRRDFTQFDADGAASVYYQVKDAAGNITRKFIMVEIVDTSIGYEAADWRTDIRFVSKKYYNLTNDGMEGAVDTFSEDSKWIKDPEYAALLTRGLNNKRVDERTVSFMGGLYTKTVAGSGHWERPPIQTWVFTHEDVLKVQEFIEIHGPGKMLEDDALQKFLVQFAHCRKTGAEAEKAANPGNRD